MKAYLEGKLPQSTYETKKASIDKEIKELEANAEKYKTIDNDMKKAVEKVISTAVNISNNSTDFNLKEFDETIFCLD